jgi:tetratricopeptide (TPR) repeat protein
MIRRPLEPVTPTLAAYADLLLKLHQLIANGRGDAEESDAIRDHMDFHWNLLDVEDLEIVRQLSADLSRIFEVEESLHPSADFYSADLAAEISKAHESKDYLRVLRLLTERPQEISFGRAAIVRGMSYRELGLVQAGLTFMWHAATRSESRESAYVIALNTMWHYVDIDAAAMRALELLREGKITGIAYLVVASLLLTAAADTNGPLRTEYAEASKLLLTNILRSAPGDEARNAQAQCHEMLSNCYFLLGETPQAIQELGTAIELTPNDGELYVQRGLILLDSNFQSAKSDFEMASEMGAVSVWPYYYLAVDAFRSQDFQRCIQMSTIAISRTADLDLQSKLHELIAMSTASKSSKLTHSTIELIRNRFRTAMILSPGDQQILANSQVFEDALHSAILQHGWILRPPVSSQRATSLAMSKRLPELVSC